MWGASHTAGPVWIIRRNKEKTVTGIYVCEIRGVTMNENNRTAKLMTIGVAVVLILVVCGISVIVHAIHKKDAEDSGSRLQSDIIDYASSGQEQSVMAQDIVKAPEKEEEPEEQAGQDEPQSDAEEPKKEAETKNEAEAKTGEPAVVVDKEQTQAAGSIIEEVKKEENQQTTAKWQKEAGENLAMVEIDLPRQMSEMKGYWEAGNMLAVEDLAYLPRYRAASEKLSGTTKYYYFGDTDGQNRPNGMGLAMYTDNQYYYGEWKDGVRSGNGMWIKFYVYDQNAKAKDSQYLQHSYSGTWGNDLPNGDGAEHYDFIDENLEENVGYNRNFIGSFKNGLYNGEIYITNYYKDGNSKEWSGTAVNGVWKSLGEKDKEGKYPVIVDLTNPDNYQWMKATENKNNGVNGLISAAK